MYNDTAKYFFEVAVKRMEEQLVKEARNGSQDALAKLLHENYAMVFKYLIKFTFNRNLAEDLAQETMVRAIEKFNLFDPARSKFSTWLIAVAQNIYLDCLRRKKREQKYIEEDLFSPGFSEQLDEHDDTLDRVLDVLGDMSDEIRLPIVLKHYYGYSLEEIASMMSIPLGTVKSRIHNGLKTIRKELADL